MLIEFLRNNDVYIYSSALQGELIRVDEIVAP
jgi:hypothetical protein